MLFIHIIIHFTPFFLNNFTGKNAHVPHKLSTTGQKTPPHLLYWPIYSFNYSQLPNQYFC